MSTKTTKADLENRLAEREQEVEQLRAALELQKLNGEAIEECRGMLAEIAHSGTYFTDVVAAVVQEVKALRYDRSKAHGLMGQIWRNDRDPRREKERPMRDGSEPQAWIAAIGKA